MHKDAKNLVFYLTQIMVSGVLMIISMPIVAHNLTPGELGQFVLAQVYAGVVVGFSNLGLLTGYERNYFLYEDSSAKLAQLIYSALAFVLVSVSLLIIGVYVYQESIGQLIFSEEFPDNLLLFVFIGSAASSLSQYYLTFYKNSGLAKYYMVFALLQSGVYFSATLLLLFLSDLKVLSLAYAWLLSNLLLLTILSLAHIKNNPVDFNWKILKEMLKISIPLTPSVFFGFISTKFDKIMLGLISSTGAVGVYNIGQTLALTIFQFMTGLGRVFQPQVYRKLFNKESDKLSEYILPFFYLSIFVALIVALFSKELILVFFPIEYLYAVYVVIVLSIYYISLFFGKITGPQLIFAKKTHIVPLLTLAGVFVNVALNVPFIIEWGIVGAAWATTITGVLITGVGYFIAQRYVRISWHVRKFLLLYGFFLLGIVFALMDYDKLIGWEILIKFSLIGLYIYLGFRLAIIDRNMVRSALLSFKGKLS